jgi:hypothetical protein
MTFSHLIDEVPWLYPHTEHSGQRFMGNETAHIDVHETPKEVLDCMIAVIHRKRVDPICYWEIQAEEQSNSSWS